MQYVAVGLGVDVLSPLKQVASALPKHAPGNMAPKSRNYHRTITDSTFCRTSMPLVQVRRGAAAVYSATMAAAGWQAMFCVSIKRVGA